MCTLYMYTTLEVEDLSPSKVNTIICLFIYMYVDIGIFISMTFVLIQFYNCTNFIKHIGLKSNYI